MKLTTIATLALSLIVMAACAPDASSNDIQREQSNQLLGEATAAVGMPAIRNFRERRLLKDIYELRDQDGLVTYTYVWNEFQGRLVFFCNSIGYGIPYAAQFTAGETMQRYLIPRQGDVQREWGVERLPQAEPNGIFPPDAAEGTWVMCRNPRGTEVRPVYVEPRVVVSPFRIEE